MKLFLLFFIFFLTLSSFIVGWILRGGYERGGFLQQEMAFEEDIPATRKQQMDGQAIGLSDIDSQNVSVSSPTLSSPKEALEKNESTLPQGSLPLATGSLERNKSTLPQGSLPGAKGSLEKKESTLSQGSLPSAKGSLETESMPSTELDPSGKTIKEGDSSERKTNISHPANQKKEKKDHLQYEAFNQEEFVKTQGEKIYFYKDGRYSFLIYVLSVKESAKNYVKSLKTRFPLWNFFIKPDSPQLRIYLGPFKTKSEAMKFIENLPTPSPFPNYFLEEEGILP